MNGVVGISDSGIGFDPVEAARRYRDSLRTAIPIPGQGLGMFLISRICDRFGWRFSIDTPPLRATGCQRELADRNRLAVTNAGK